MSYNIQRKQLPVVLSASYAATASYATYIVAGGGNTPPGGTIGQIQFQNSSNLFDGVPTLTYDGTTLRGTGSFTGSFSGSLFGTASYSTTALYALNVQTIDTSSLVTTTSFHTFTSSYKIDSSSFDSRINNITNIDISNLVTTTSFYSFTSSYKIDSSSFKSSINDINTNITYLVTTTSFYSFTGSINSFTSSYNVDSGSFNTSINNLTSTNIGTSSPLQGGGDLSQNRTISMPSASGTADGYLKSSDWNIFNNKLGSGDFKTIEGNTIVGAGDIDITKTNVGLGNVDNVQQLPISYLATATDMGNTGASDSKVPTQKAVKTFAENLLLTTVRLKSSWDANTNNPDLLSIISASGDAYVVTASGTTTLNGINSWQINDIALVTDTGWIKIDNTSLGTTWGNITGQISDNAALSSSLASKVENTSNSPGDNSIVVYDGSTGVKIKTSSKTIVTTLSTSNNEIPTAGAVSDSLSSYEPILAKGNITINSPLTFTGTNIGAVIGGGLTISIPSASSTTDGYLKSSDWTAFNSKEPALTKGDVTINSPLSATGTTSGAVIGSGLTISIPSASSTIDGYLKSGDWTTFNNKQNSLSGTGIVKSSGGTISYITDNSSNWDIAYTNRITSLTTNSISGPATLINNVLNIPQYSGGSGNIASINSLTDPVQVIETGSSGTDFNISSTNATHSINIPTANSSNRGLLSSTDWTTFNNKQNDLDTGNAGNVNRFLYYDGTWALPPGGAPTGQAGGDLGGSYPNPTVNDDSHTHSFSTLTGVVPDNRSITFSSPFSGGGTLSGNLSISMPSASGTANGYLTSTDWNTFNNKLGSSTFKTVNNQSIIGTGNIAISKNDVGLGNVTNDEQMPIGYLSVDDTLGGQNSLDTLVPSQKAVKTYVDNSVASAIQIQGGWDAFTNNTSTGGQLQSGTGSPGDAWVVTEAGTTNLDGVARWEINDLALYTNAGWVKIDNSSTNLNWGGISGTLTDQTDLSGSLASKLQTSGSGLFDNTIVIYSNRGENSVVSDSGKTIATAISNDPNSVPTTAAVYDAITVSTPIPDATSTIKGVIQLAGDLGGNATAPTVPGLANKEDTANKETNALDNDTTKYPNNNVVKTYVDTNALLKSGNLSGLNNTTTARSNLGLGTAATKDIPNTGDASNTQVVYGTDTRLTDRRSHNYYRSAGLWYNSAGTPATTVMVPVSSNITYIIPFIVESSFTINQFGIQVTARTGGTPVVSVALYSVTSAAYAPGMSGVLLNASATVSAVPTVIPGTISISPAAPGSISVTPGLYAFSVIFVNLGNTFNVGAYVNPGVNHVNIGAANIPINNATANAANSTAVPGYLSHTGALTPANLSSLTLVRASGNIPAVWYRVQ